MSSPEVIENSSDLAQQTENSVELRDMQIEGANFLDTAADDQFTHTLQAFRDWVAKFKDQLPIG